MYFLPADETRNYYQHFLKESTNNLDNSVNYIGDQGDFSSFAFQAGIPSMDIKFKDKINDDNPYLYPAQTTKYDTFKYFEDEIDRNYKTLETCAQLVVILIRELADSLLLPFNLLEYVRTLKEAWKNLEEKVQESLKDDKGVDREGWINGSLSEMRDDDTFIGFDILNDGIEDFKKQVNIWNCKLQNPMDTDYSNPMTARMLNDQMLQLEKIFMNSHDNHKSGAEIQNVGNSNLVLLQGGLKNGKANFPNLIHLLEKFQEDNVRTDWIDSNEGKIWRIGEKSGWEMLNRNITDIYVMLNQATSHLKTFHQFNNNTKNYNRADICKNECCYQD